MLQSLRARLTAISIFIMTCSLVILAVVTFIVVQSNILYSLDERLNDLTDLYAGELTQWIKEKQQVTSSIQEAIDREDPYPFLRAAIQAGGLDDAYFVYSDDRGVFLAPESARPEDYSGVSRPWYRQAVAERKPSITPAYPDISSGKLAISFVEPVIKNGAIHAVISTDMRLDSVMNKINSIRPTHQSFAILLDGDFNILAYKDTALSLKPVSTISSALNAEVLKQLAMDEGHVKIDIGGVPQMLYAAQVPGTSWLLAIAIDYKEAMRPLSYLMQVMTILACVCVLIASLSMVTVVGRQLSRLVHVGNALSDIASGEGDLTKRVDSTGNDELTHIARAFNQFADKIAGVLLKIRDASQAVRLASGEIASGNSNLSCRTEQQASALEETAAAMEELTSTVQQNAENARQANQLASNTSEVVERAGGVVAQVVQTMNGIDTASRKIVDIISVIDAIAFQTNILALNAAVEAARAGEQGKGFAVVAAEVRTLAQRSATAAKEIKSLIDDSVAQVSIGNGLVRGAGEAMREVVDSIHLVRNMVEEISHASQEQSRGIKEVGGAVMQMDEGTQQNAALVEEAATAAQALQMQAAQLADVVANFKLPSQLREGQIFSADQQVRLDLRR